MKNYLLVITALLALPASTQTTKLHAGDDIDCARVVESAREQCYAGQGKEPPKKEPMNLPGAQALIEAAHDTARDCKIKLDVYGKSSQEFQSCRRDLLPLLGEDGGNYQEALHVIMEAVKDEKIPLFTAKLLTNAIQETAKNVEYIALRSKTN